MTAVEDLAARLYADAMATLEEAPAWSNLNCDEQRTWRRQAEWQYFGELRQVMRRKYCAEDVSRRGQSEPCDKPAVAVRVDTDGGPYEVCAYHARQPMVPLADLFAAGGSR